MNLLQQLTFIYLSSYLLMGGLGLLVVPELTLRLLLSNGSYGDVRCRAWSACSCLPSEA